MAQSKKEAAGPVSSAREPVLIGSLGWFLSVDMSTFIMSIDLELEFSETAVVWSLTCS